MRPGESGLGWLGRAAAAVWPATKVQAPEHEHEHEVQEAQEALDPRAKAAAQVYFARWWAEARWGLVRVATMPREVALVFRQLMDARRFVAAAVNDIGLWQAGGFKHNRRAHAVVLNRVPTYTCACHPWADWQGLGFGLGNSHSVKGPRRQRTAKAELLPPQLPAQLVEAVQEARARQGCAWTTQTCNNW